MRMAYAENFGMLTSLGASQPTKAQAAGKPKIGFCGEKHRLMHEFLDTIREITTVQNLQTKAVIEGDPDFARFDVLLHLAQERKDQAKYAWIAHVEFHHCEEA